MSEAIRTNELKQQVIEKLGTVIDPCMEAAGLNLSVIDLGIVREVSVDADQIRIEMGLTEPGCGFTHALVTQVEDAVECLKGTRALNMTFNWSDPWTEESMTDTGRTVMMQARERGVNVLRRFDIGSGFRSV